MKVVEICGLGREGEKLNSGTQHLKNILFNDVLNEVKFQIILLDDLWELYALLDVICNDDEQFILYIGVHGDEQAFYWHGGEVCRRRYCDALQKRINDLEQPGKLSCLGVLINACGRRTSELQGLIMKERRNHVYNLIDQNWLMEKYWVFTSAIRELWKTQALYVFQRSINYLDLNNHFGFEIITPVHERSKRRNIFDGEVSDGSVVAMTIMACILKSSVPSTILQEFARNVAKRIIEHHRVNFHKHHSHISW